MILAPNSSQHHGKKLAVLHEVVFNDGTKRQRREECKCADKNDCADEQRDKQRAVRGQRAAGGGDFLFASQATGGGQQRNQEHEAADEHGEAEREVVPGRIDGDASQRRCRCCRWRSNTRREFR